MATRRTRAIRPFDYANLVNVDTRSARGGNWYNNASYLPAAYRGGWAPTAQYDTTGLRCAR